MKALHIIAFILLVIGGLNWLVLGLSGWDIGMLFGGQGAIISRVIYVLVGLAAVYSIVMHKRECKVCSGSNAASAPAMPSQPTA